MLENGRFSTHYEQMNPMMMQVIGRTVASKENANDGYTTTLDLV